MLKIDGYDSACIGVITKLDGTPVLAYSWELLVKCSMEEHGMEDWEEAVEYVEFNIVGAYVGEDTPLIVMPRDDRTVDELADYYGGDEAESAKPSKRAKAPKKTRTPRK